MSHAPTSWIGRVRALEERVERIEEHLGIAPIVTPVVTHAEPATAAPPVDHAAPAPALPTRKAVHATRRTALDETETDRKQISFEQLLGGRVFAIGGALIVVLAVTFFVKLAWDMGWVSLSPLGRCLTAWAFGVALLVGAEVAQRRINAFAAIGMNIAGLATLYITTFVAVSNYGLISAPLAFAMLACTGVAGILLSLRAKYVSVALVSLAASYAAPFILAEFALPMPVLVPLYSLLLLSLALVISSLREVEFGVLRRVAYLIHLPTVGLWGLFSSSADPGLTLVALVGTWVLINADALLVASRGTVAIATTKEADVSDARHVAESNASLASVLGVTLWTLSFGLLVVRREWPEFDWALPASITVVSAIVAHMSFGVMRTLGSSPETERQRLAIAHIAQAGACLLIAVALATTEWMTVACWLAFAVASSFVRRLARAERLEFFMYATLALGVLHTTVLTPWMPTGATPHALVGELFLTRGTLAFALCGLAWIVTGLLDRQRVPTLAHLGIGCASIAAGFVNTVTPPAWITGAWLTVTLALSLTQLTTRRLLITRPALALLWLTLLAWVYAFLIDEPWMLSASAIGLHPGFILSLVMVALAAGLARAASRQTPDAPAEQRLPWVRVPIGACVLFLLVTTSLEVVRAADVIAESEQTRRAALSIWWGLYAIPVLVVGFIRKIPIARLGALGLISLAATKALVYDLFLVDAIWRVVIFLVIGLLMMAVALGYAQATRSSSRRDGVEQNPDGVPQDQHADPDDPDARVHPKGEEEAPRETEP